MRKLMSMYTNTRPQISKVEAPRVLKDANSFPQVDKKPTAERRALEVTSKVSFSKNSEPSQKHTKFFTFP